MPSRAFEDLIELETATVEPVPFGRDGSFATYPLPQLRLTGRREGRPLLVVVLENDRLKATVAPSLGGRVLALFDKRSSLHAIPLPSRIEPSACGARGLWLQHGAQVSLGPERDSMASFNHVVYAPEEEGGPCAVLLYALAPGTGLGLQVCFTLSDGDAALLVEARVFNRTLLHQPFSLSVCCDGQTTTVAAPALLSPRDTLAFRFQIAPAPTGVRVDGTEEHGGPTSLEPPDNGTSEQPDSLPIQLRGAAHVGAANEAARNGDFRSALGHLDSALSTLGDDPLAWWQRAVLSRLAGEADEERDDLTMAHALSPLEPALRGEAFLSMPQGREKEPSAVLAPLVSDLDALHEAVHLLVEAGLFQEAARLIDEAQRHGEHPLLRYVYAWCLVHATRMDVEAAAEVGRAAKSQTGPPFPWREHEVRAVTELAAKFPSDQRLQALKTLLEKRSGPAT